MSFFGAGGNNQAKYQMEQLTFQKQEIKLICLNSCLNLENESLNETEKQCIVNCREKIDNYLRFADALIGSEETSRIS